MSDEINVDIRFTDLTMIEAEGNYDQVKALIESEFPYPDTWAVKSDVAIESDFGLCEIICEFRYTGDILILDFNPSTGDTSLNMDVNILTSWALHNGWNTPAPIRSIVEDNIDFWKFFWETHLIESTYLEDMFGPRADSLIQEDDDELD